jgi:putative glutamine amidotransferase
VVAQARAPDSSKNFPDQPDIGATPVAPFLSMRRPIIGITQSSSLHHPRTPTDYLFRIAYYQAVQQAGGVPVAVGHDIYKVDPIHLDGILFSGGGDINPCVYGEETVEYALGIDDQRDLLELQLLYNAVHQGIPFLGICRGLQLINVALGGDLYRDLAGQRSASMDHDWYPSRKVLAHTVSLELSSPLQAIGFDHIFSVNSLHHQGIRDVGAGLSVIAHASDGLIEGIQLTGHHFGLAVQWHPEWLIDQPPTRNLFKAFIHACERNLR